ncbi:unnamed protein product [Darwinula stevensoni]|uniref:Peptidase S1 domain-containing protein n=1 Tax=Darwinula stevensoni TaxID=69355 RepID=A0A7R9ADZ4_9CRUS|nr:unnamed protein product [Darwinula stevensoni]CAG0901824.1 unnamed protein product [Darwinula stevensoni]
MRVSCSKIDLSGSQGCRNADFVINGKSLCGKEGLLRSSMHVGRTLNAMLYTVGPTRSAPNVRCNIECGGGGERRQDFDRPRPVSGSNRQADCNREKVEGGGGRGEDNGLMGKVEECARKTESNRFVCLTDSFHIYPPSVEEDQYRKPIEYKSERLRITLGEHDTSTTAEAMTLVQELLPTNVLVHPQFNEKALDDNDMALVKLNTPVDWQAFPNIRPICLPGSAPPGVGLTGTIVGWGTTAARSFDATIPTTSKIVREAEVKTWSLDECKNALVNDTLTENMFCASGTAAIGVCWGDGGGPLMLPRGNDVFEQAGIISFGPKGCQEILLPGVYTQVSNYLSFIKDSTADAVWC